MALWINAPDWSDKTAVALIKSLSSAFYRVRDIEEIWVSVGMDPADISWERKARLLWRTLAQKQTRLVR